MHRWTLLPRWVRGLLDRRAVEADLDDEVRGFAEELTARRIRDGMEPAEARRVTLAEMGGIEPVKEQVREVRVGMSLELFLKDLGLAWRGLRRDRGFATATVSILAVGIAASTSLFAVIDAIVFRPLPYEGADRIASVRLVQTSGPPRRGNVTTEEFLQLRRASTLDGAYIKDSFTKTLTGESFPESVWTEYYAADALVLLGVQPLIGRVFTEADAPIGQEPERVAVLTYGFWQRHFGGQQDIVGKTLRLDGDVYVVIGVLPPKYSLDLTDIIVPLHLTSDPDVTWPALVRVKPHVPLRAAEAELQQLYQQFAQNRPDRFPPAFRVQLTRLVDEERGAAHVPVLVLLFASAALLLLIGCANVTFLLLARGTRRRHEVAIRHALGASRTRLVTQLFTETLSVTVMAAALAVTFIYWVMPLVLTQVPGFIQRRADSIAVSWPTILFASLLAALIAAVSGTWPALAASRTRSDAVRDATGSRGTSRASRVGSGGLIASQVALAVVLLAGTGAAIRTVVELYQVPVGYDPENVTSAQIYLPIGSYTTWPERVALYERVRAEVANAPGVEASTVSLIPTGPPPSSGMDQRFEIPGDGAADDRRALVHSIASDYFSTLKIPMVRGRMWSASDDVRAEPVAVINETMARHVWPDEALGKRVRLPAFTETRAQWVLNAPGRDGWFEIIGVVRDTPNRGLREPTSPAIYIPYTLALSDVAVVVIRTTGDPVAAERAIRVHVSRADSNLPVIRFISAETFTGREQERFVATMLLGFGCLALLLAGFGLFSVASYSVSHRTREFGIRIALGASRSGVLWCALRSVTAAVAGGLGIGLVLSVLLNTVLARWAIRRMDDPLVLGAAIGVLLVVIVAAALIPGRRATSIEPAVALRGE